MMIGWGKRVGSVVRDAVLLFDQSDDPAGAQTGGAQADKFLSVLQRGNAARRLDLHPRRDMRCQQCDICRGRTAGGKAG